MKRILFVDDEEMALKALQRLLRPMRGEWEMEFVDSGFKALEQMSVRPADVIVSDMRMPGMNGAQLLNEVMQRYPRTVRLILSGFADRELILKCVGSTHQYLAKPCEPDALKMTLLRAARMDESLDNATLRQLVTRCVNLPTVPAVYSKVVEVLQDPDASIDVVGDIVADWINWVTAHLLMREAQELIEGKTVWDQGKATVRSVKGNVEALAGNRWQNLKPGMILLPGTLITTEADSEADFSVNGVSSAIKTGPDSIVILQTMARRGAGAETVIKTVMYLKSGTILGQCKRVSASSRFEIHTPNHSVLAMSGGEFMVTVTPASFGSCTATFSSITGMVTASTVANGKLEEHVLKDGESWVSGRFGLQTQ